jgi:hypothetical protein
MTDSTTVAATTPVTAPVAVTGVVAGVKAGVKADVATVDTEAKSLFAKAKPYLIAAAVAAVAVLIVVHFI